MQYGKSVIQYRNIKVNASCNYEYELTRITNPRYRVINHFLKKSFVLPIPKKQIIKFLFLKMSMMQIGLY